MRSEARRRSAPLIRENVPMREMTTLAVGGPARYLADVSSLQEYLQARRWAESRGLPVLVLGEGSNVLAADAGFPGLVIRNCIRGIERDGLEVRVGGGENLPGFIRWLNREGLAGMERMYGIPGTVAGAVVGNAGAYGQEIGERVVEVRAWTADGETALLPERLGFRYRHSAFKEHRGWFLLDCLLRLEPGKGNLQAVSDTILEKREAKYPPGLKCPGSYFKNVPAEEIPPEIRQRLPEEFFYYGKVPAGVLLEAVGAKGAHRGGAEIATYHGNLVINRDRASSKDLEELAFDYAERVWDRYRIRLEPEILILDEQGAILG